MIRVNLMRLLVFLALLGVTTSLQANDRMRLTPNLRALKEDDAADADANNNDDAYANEMIVNQSQQDDLVYAVASTEEQSDRGGNIFVDQVQQIKNTAESQAWDFYSHAPSDWTNAEWNVVFVLIAISSLSCCCMAGCFFYCCIRSDDDGDKEKEGRFRRPRIVCRRRRVVVKGDNSPNRGQDTDAKSHSTASSGKSFESLEIEDDKNKPLLEQERGLIRNMSLVKSFEQILMPKTKSRSQRTAAATVKSEPAHYSRMKV
ncbi:hypothetical protein ACHAXN_002749 [Cyclotella atomus]